MKYLLILLTVLLAACNSSSSSSSSSDSSDSDDSNGEQETEQRILSEDDAAKATPVVLDAVASLLVNQDKSPLHRPMSLVTGLHVSVDDFFDARHCDYSNAGDFDGSETLSDEIDLWCATSLRVGLIDDDDEDSGYRYQESLLTIESTALERSGEAEVEVQWSEWTAGEDYRIEEDDIGPDYDLAGLYDDGEIADLAQSRWSFQVSTADAPFGERSDTDYDARLATAESRLVSADDESWVRDARFNELNIDIKGDTANISGRMLREVPDVGMVSYEIIEVHPAVRSGDQIESSEHRIEFDNSDWYVTLTTLGEDGYRLESNIEGVSHVYTGNAWLEWQTEMSLQDHAFELALTTESDQTGSDEAEVEVQASGYYKVPGDLIIGGDLFSLGTSILALETGDNDFQVVAIDGLNRRLVEDITITQLADAPEVTLNPSTTLTADDTATIEVVVSSEIGYTVSGDLSEGD
ncbi:MAG: hypothetical protein LAT62_11305, partial [Natronospirillum sp.]|uniref:hypothetical protein n=1 Tax=Natronospirillum sp. TaxID=2812955 RepID=UPI0025D5E85B